MGVALRRLPAALAACALVLGACGGGGGDPEPVDTGAPPVTSPPPGESPAAPVEGPPRLVKVGDFEAPVYVASPPGDPRIFVVEQEGRVVQLENGRAKEPAFLDIRELVGYGGERGLFSIAFAPDYPQSGLAYLSYTNRSGDSRIDEYRVDPSNPDRLDPGSRREVLGIDQPFGNHNGGLILFDPTGMLIFGTGDGGGAGDPGNRAQNLGTQLGKLLRIDPRRQEGGRGYAIPSGNPFAGREGADPAIWAYGLRNPWRFAFDPSTGDLYVADVGQNAREEVSFVPPGEQAGANYGWPRFEGSQRFKDVSIDESALVEPVAELRQSEGNCSITGGGVYRGSAAALRGYYLYTDFCEGVLHGLRMEGGRVADRQTYAELRVENPSSFGEDSAGEMYVTSLSGSVYRIAAG